MHFQILSNGNFGKIGSELCSPLRHRSRTGVCFFARSSPALWNAKLIPPGSPDRATGKFTLRSLCLCGENRFGFTLMEILIAMFIFAVVLSTIYSSYTGTHRIMAEAGSQADIYAMARVALERMQEDLGSVYIPPKGDKSPGSDEEEADEEEGAFVGEDKEIKGRSAAPLRFTSRAHLVFSEQEQASGTAEIAYYVEEYEEGEGFVLYRNDRLLFEEASEEGGGGLPLCEGLVSVDFTYYDAQGEEYETWASPEEGIPQIVSLSLEFANREILYDAFLDVVQSVVVRVQYLAGLFHVDLFCCRVVPRQRGDGFQVITRNDELRGIRVHEGELLQFLLPLFCRALGVELCGVSFSLEDDFAAPLLAVFVRHPATPLL